MRHFRLAAVFLLLLLTLGFSEATAQKERSQSPKQQAKEQSRLKKEREDKIDKEIKAREDYHDSIQDKATRKRMKRNERKSRRLARGKSAPFYHRWFGRN
jgi:hypothetical protein